MSRWVLIDETAGTPCSNGEVMTAAKLAVIAEALTIQLNRDYAAECGGNYSVRAGASKDDVQAGEKVFAFLPSLPAAPGAVAYHDVDGLGVPFALEAISACSSLTGSGDSASVAASHELLEEEGDPGCNQLLDDRAGTLHAKERCDAVESNDYAITTSSGDQIRVSDFVLDAWTIPGAPGPYTYTAKAGLPSVSQPAGPMQTAPADGGNYQLECPSTTSQESQVMGKHAQAGFQVAGRPRRAHRVGHWATRTARRQRQG